MNMSETQLARFGLNNAELKDLADAGRILVPQLDHVLDAFYDRTRAQPDAALFFKSDDSMNQARNAQKIHWTRMLNGDLNADYFASIERIGRVHAAINLPLELYMSSYAHATSDLLERFLSRVALKMIGPSGRRWRRMAGVLSRAFALDIEQVTTVTFRVWGEEQQIALGHVSDGIDALARGDLSHVVPGPGESNYPLVYDPVRQKLNGATRSLGNIVSTVSHSMTQMQNVVGQVGQSAGELSRRTSSQAASLEETTAAMQMINESVRDSSQKTHETRSFFDNSQREMKESASQVETAADVMTEIRRSSEKIAQIIGLIDDIAFQTNLLALNAGVEAARAGDAGRGFAVVAGEVRTLAANSSEAASQIRTLIQSSSEQVNDGAVLVERARGSLISVVDSFDTMFDVLNSITEGSSEQAKGLDEISQSIGDLDRITQSNAAMVEQTSDAVDTIARVVQDITGQLSQVRYAEQMPGWTVQSESASRSAA
ncbi:methyl-accepting chemotaxis sensory transducer [Citreicella sp. 357]|nr:methyl-accepting chemotaxis sensory transducer [Citreicella sp. 357]